MGASGLALVGFLVMHLLGNLLLYLPTGSAFNEYAQKLHSFGPLMYVAEVGLLVLFLMHAVLAIKLKIENKAARGSSYDSLKTKGGPSRWSLASTNMAVSGIVILIFLVVHIRQLRFGPSIESGYVATVKGEQSRDLYRLVFETFKNPSYMWFYVVVMLLLGAHLLHGFWSAFQSLGVMRPRFSKAINVLAILIALMFAIGFLGIPLYIHYVLPGAPL